MDRAEERRLLDEESERLTARLEATNLRYGISCTKVLGAVPKQMYGSDLSEPLTRDEALARAARVEPRGKRYGGAMSITVKRFDHYDVHQDESGEVVSVVARQPPKRVPRTFEEYQALSDDEKRDLRERMRESKHPMTFGEFVEQMDGVQEVLAKHVGDLMKTIKGLRDRIDELEKRPIPRFVSVVRPSDE